MNDFDFSNLIIVLVFLAVLAGVAYAARGRRRGSSRASSRGDTESDKRYAAHQQRWRSQMESYVSERNRQKRDERQDRP